MFAEELKLIKKAEDDAAEAQKDARLEAKRLVEEATSEAAKIVEAAEASAKERIAALKAEGDEQAKKNYEEALKEAEHKAAALVGTANKEQAVKEIAERIVKISGDH